MRLLLCLAVPFVAADLFTSIADMQSLLDTEKAIPGILKKYISEEQHRLEQLRQHYSGVSESARAWHDEFTRDDWEKLDDLKKLAEKYQESNAKQIENGIKDITNPINAFLMIKKKIFDWKEIQSKMTSNSAEDFITHISNQNYGVRYPTEEDLTGAAIGLLRLQDTYRLDTSDLAAGRIKKDQGNYTFGAKDCFEIGRAAYNAEDYYHVIMWMEEALALAEKEEEKSVHIPEIIEYLSFAMYKQGNLKHALKYAEQLYKMEPSHPRAKGNVKWYEDMLLDEGVKRSEMRRSLPPVSNQRPISSLGNDERTMYEALCREEIPVSVKETSKLYCYYKRDRPFLVLAPIKVDIQRFNPLAVLFRDVVSDDEIEVIQQLATPKLARATVQDSVTGNLVTATYRISKSAWLKGYEHEVVDRVNQRLEMMTNLEMETAEELQIANYGIGGHYDPHFDHARKEETKAFESLGTGNRIATVLFYMSQPTRGGGTVFTEVKSTIMPSKNDALFWYNLHKMGDGDERTRHAACPVLVGIKWVSNKWIHERGQEIRRPCGLKYTGNGERFVGDLGFEAEPINTPNFSPHGFGKDPWGVKIDRDEYTD